MASYSFLSFPTFHYLARSFLFRIMLYAFSVLETVDLSGFKGFITLSFLASDAAEST